MIDLNLTAQRGSLSLKIKCRLEAPWTVVFGPSGAGKTTLLRLIASLEKPDTGHVLLPPGRKVGMVSQQSALFPNMNVASNVAFGIHQFDRPARQKAVAEMLAFVGASELTDRFPAALSGGEAQRVSLARALAPAPQVLLLDEPLSALDASARDELLSRLKPWLAERKIQTILVTHDAADALATEAEVLQLNEGRVLVQGSAANVLATEKARILARLGTS